MLDPNKFFDNNGNFISGGRGTHQPTTHHKIEGFFQPSLIYRKEIKISRKKKEIVAFQFSCPTIFTTKEEATAYLPYYIRFLIKSGDLPKEVVDDNNFVNEDLLIPSLVTLNIGELKIDGKEK